MRSVSRGSLRALPVVLALIVGAGAPLAQEAGGADKVEALKQSLHAGMEAIRKYEWVETTTVSIKGEEKTSKQSRCYYGADGKVQKIPMDTGQGGSQQKDPPGLRGRIVKHKKEDMTEYAEDAQALIKQYVPPDPAKIQAAKDAGNLSITPLDSGKVQLRFRDYIKDGDALSITLDPATNHLLGVQVDSYLKKPEDAVTLDVTMNTLQDGALYASEIVLNGESKHLRVDVQNTGYTPHEPGQ